MKEKFLLLILIVTLFSPIIATAHPGRTAGDGCHYCRTNCSSWGEAWNQRHCHGGSKAPAAPKPSYTPTPIAPPTPVIPSCPTNGYYNYIKEKCNCYTGYAPSLNKQTCIKIPKNAHGVTSSTDVWLCDSGYEELDNTCIPIKEEPELTEEEEIIIPTPILHEITDTKSDTETEKDDLPEIKEIPIVKPKIPTKTTPIQQNIDSADEPTDNMFGFWTLILGSSAFFYWRYKKKNK